MFIMGCKNTALGGLKKEKYKCSTLNVQFSMEGKLFNAVAFYLSIEH
jgi:hypothetical protein